MEANQRASQSAAAFSPKHTTPPQSTEDTEMEVDTDGPMVLRTLKEEFLRMEIEDPLEDSLTDYPESLEFFKSHFTTWCKHRQNEKDNMPTSKSKQYKAIYFATVCHQLDYEKFFQDRHHMSYFEVLYELTLGMTIRIDKRTEEEKLNKQRVVFIPFCPGPPILPGQPSAEDTDCMVLVGGTTFPYRKRGTFGPLLLRRSSPAEDTNRYDEGI
jgi:hypothetical protein